ncbi:unnamed protein product [Meganyctiphanes norvegica]|uniref:Peptidase S1 domain-containing protein n=1 Tax=Meganyctiphanes norvegica TaxID=48144 RepID=A0AAV2R6E9_MEGNR
MPVYMEKHIRTHGNHSSSSRCRMFMIILFTVFLFKSGSPISERNCGTILSKRIVGGAASEISHQPWMAHMRFKVQNRSVNCGASLIQKQWLLSTAHCFRKLRDDSLLIIRLGYTDLIKPNSYSRIAVTNKKYIHIHPNFSPTSAENDISLIQLPREVTMNPYIKTICLGNEFDIPFEKTAVAAGWGSHDYRVTKVSKSLHTVILDVTRRAYCNSYTRSTNFICAYTPGKDTCIGDSGGPLSVVRSGKWTQVGIISHGPRECGLVAKPGVYTNLSKFRSWISNIIRTHS